MNRLSYRLVHELGAGQWVPAIVDPPPGKSGLVRDIALRARLRRCLDDEGINPDDFSANQIKKLVEVGKLSQASGVPIRSVVLLWTMSDPVVVSTWATDHATGNRVKVYDATTGAGDARAARAYIGGNNHHIEIRVDAKDRWSGEIVSAHVASQRKSAKLRAFRRAGIPKQAEFRKLSKAEQDAHRPALRDIERKHPIVDRSDSDDKGGSFVMSLCEGETILMKHKKTGEVGYFVVAKLDKPRNIVVVPHWDARAAGERKDAEGKAVADSKREQFSVTPTDLKDLAPPGYPHAVKVRVTPLGRVKVQERD